MRNLIRRSVRLALLVLVGLVAFNTYNFAWVWGMSEPAERLTLERCPLPEAERYLDYLLSVSGLLGEARSISTTSTSEAEIAQKYLGLSVRLEEVQPPACASFLHETIKRAFENEAKAYAALAEGGVFSRLRYQYYHMLSVDALYLVPFIVRLLEPPLPIPDDGQYHA